MRTLRRALWIGSVLLVMAGGLAPRSAAAQATPPQAELARQIAALRSEKVRRTPAQRKISSRLLYEGRMRRGAPVAEGIAQLHTGVQVDAAGATEIDLRGTISAALLGRIGELGGRVTSSFPAYRTLRAHVPLDRIEDLAAHPDVLAIHPAGRAMTHKLNTSQGDLAHRAASARTSFGVDGTGVTVGVLSDGVSSLAAVQSSGDLPAVTVLPGQAGSGDEGTAMLEIIHDLAPGAALQFATAFTSQASFANNIIALWAAGSDIIVDDVGYFAEAVYQDDDVAAAVGLVTASGALYFSSAGNSGNLDDGTSGVWEGDFNPGSSFQGDPAHDFGGGNIRNTIDLVSPFVYTLQWSDPQGNSTNDYDLYLVNPGGNQVFAASTDAQNGAGDDPFEIIGAGGSNAGFKLIVVQFSGANRFLQLNAHRGRLAIGTDGQLWGHAGARGALAVAAVDGRFAATGFDGTESVQTYSSDGPRRVFFEASGSAITPGDFSSTGGELRQKPEITAADCVATASPGFATFCGTSAAAPHAAAIAALLLERAGGPGVADLTAVTDALTGTALDIEAAGVDRNSGAGIVMADAAAADLCGSDPDCDDGDFCNGSETCDSGVCFAGVPPVCNGATPFCDSGLGQCVACLTAGDCDDGAFCTGVETCTAGACGAGTPPVCDGTTPFCDESADACTECLVDGDCADPLFCNGDETCAAGVCTAGAPPVCSGSTPFCDDALATCVECLVPLDCDDGLFCSGAEICAAGSCGAGTPPVCDPGTPLCDETGDACVECLIDDDCGAGTCNAGSCAAPQIPAFTSARGPIGVGLALLVLGGAALGARVRRVSG